ncbi:hypothetical protein LguiB_005092 [Lonicera macranthoides]
MAKKKATMTLKDFHGGSIPSDLPLPSAPGAVIVKPLDRASFDRQTSWGNPMGRSDQWLLRPSSAGSMRNFDDKTPFLTHSSHIGRNFDEDERKPLDGISPARIMVPIQVEPKVEYLSTEREPNRPHTTPAFQLSSGTTSSYAARFTESTNVGRNSQNSQNVGGLYPNAWGTRKEVVGADTVATSWSGPDPAMKLAHASALDKVSSGRWHSKQLIHPTDVEVIKHPERKNDFYSKGSSVSNKRTGTVMDVPSGREFYERARSPMYSEMKEKNPQMYVDELQSPRNAGKFGGSEQQAPVPSDSLERPKLKLLPRSKPSENVEPEPFVDYNQGYQHRNDTSPVENNIETWGNALSIKHGLPASESGNQVIERPKLNLKPRSQPPEQLMGNAERERNVLFGGARPREMVLKERGIDDVAANIQNQGQPPNGTETLPVHGTPTAYTEKVEKIPLDHRTSKNTDRRDHRANLEKTEVHKYWRSENRRSSREVDKPQPQERPHSPDTWRKPIEQPASHDSRNLRYGKAASAVELAQAFSTSISDPKTAGRFHSQRGTPVQGEIPFSRLTGPHPRPQINGY